MATGVLRGGILHGAELCDDCGSIEKLLYDVGNDRRVCSVCFDGYEVCDGCGKYFKEGGAFFAETEDGEWLCPDCAAKQAIKAE